MFCAAAWLIPGALFSLAHACQSIPANKIYEITTTTTTECCNDDVWEFFWFAKSLVYPLSIVVHVDYIPTNKNYGITTTTTECYNWTMCENVVLLLGKRPALFCCVRIYTAAR
jgi:hypothetical protein